MTFEQVRPALPEFILTACEGDRTRLERARTIDVHRLRTARLFVTDRARVVTRRTRPTRSAQRERVARAAENPRSSPLQVSTHWALTSSFVKVSGCLAIVLGPCEFTAVTVAW